MGPTAVGKTDLAIDLYTELANDLPLDIISVDSAMVYRGLDIGTGKPIQALLDSVPHYLVDIREPEDIYSVADFYSDAVKYIDTAHSKGRVPLLVGGTMMYFKALQQGLAKLPSSDSNVRAKLHARLVVEGLNGLYNELEHRDPVSANRINPNDTQRILRALEIYYISGQTMTKLLAKNKSVDVNMLDNQQNCNYNFINIIISPEDRTILHKRIALRFNSMLEKGFIAEVEKLFKNDKVSAHLPAIRSCGYRQIWQYLSGELCYDEMVDRSIISTRQLAKRQLTWLRAWQDAEWFNTESTAYREEIIKYLLSFGLFKRIV